jgi:Tfp pilus assembly protein PilF
MYRTIRLSMLLVAGATIQGCGSPAKQAQTRETAAQSYQAGVSALENRDYSGAKENLTLALESGHLGYVTTNAFMKRAIANAALGDFDAAHADLDTATKGEGETAEIFSARTYVFEKQGKSTEAKAAWNQARKLDRGVKRIDD